MFPTTTRIPNRSSRRSNTARDSRNASVPPEDARSFCRRYFHWYKGSCLRKPKARGSTRERAIDGNQHRHSGIGMMTPASVHEGRAEEIRTARQKVLEQAFQAHPERFSKGRPKPPALPSPAWINPPKKEIAA